ncbi:MAG: hypothetical protein JOZ32_03740 [Bryobacterales bacterium]|nr:hypothetical protein [Bryobacterales bacterium]
MLNVQLPAIVLLASAFLCQAKTIVVTNTNASGAGSLPDAVTGASAGDTITFNLTYPANIVLCGSVDIYTNIAIEGPGASQLALSEGMDCIASIVRVFGATVQISGLTIQNGGYPFAGFDEDAGGISNHGGTVTLSKSMLSGNSTHTCGGGISNSGTLTVIGSTLSYNYSDDMGGAICGGPLH